MTSSAVVACTWGEDREGLPIGAEEVLTLARKLSAPLGVDLNWLVLGAMPDRTSELAASYGVAALDRIEDDKLGSFQPDAYVEALAQYCAQHSPKAFLFSQTFDGRLIAPRLAGRLGWGASAYGGDTRVVYELAEGGSCIVAVMANATQPQPLEQAGSDPTPRETPVDLSSVAERIQIVEPARTEGPRLEDAEVIVAGGRGLGSPENYKLVQELAEALGGMAGASRPLVDDGWVDSSQQVGLTGKITRPGLYIAAGISGASQHMAGCAAAKTIVAINNDADAAVFRYARYGIVNDCLEILPELIRAVKER
jgi:electron transfer flavoprotein alpha subunit